MNKQELINKAVEELNGIWPSTGTGWIGITLSGRLIDLRDQGQPLCTREEFIQRAIELGWINGYKYGVEYPTNGKKPDLPDGIFVDLYIDSDVEHASGWLKEGNTVGSRNWSSTVILKFKIIDERYKPKPTPDSEITTSMRDASDTNEGSWYVKNGFPPIGSECELRPYWHNVEIIAHHEGAAVYYDKHDLKYDRCPYPDHFRLIKTEKEILIEKTSIAIHRWEIEHGKMSSIELAERLYNEGLLKTK